jgi:hypothetical protein
MESPKSGRAFPQSNQELFGYYIDNVLERRDSDHDDPDIFISTTPALPAPRDSGK